MLESDRGRFDRLPREIEYPVTTANFDRVTKTCHSKRELFAHLTDTTRTDQNAIDRIITGQCVHPEYFISRESMLLIGHFKRFQRYGMDVLYADSDPPASVMQAFDLIQNCIDSHEVETTKELKRKAKTK